MNTQRVSGEMVLAAGCVVLGFVCAGKALAGFNGFGTLAIVVVGAAGLGLLGLLSSAGSSLSMSGRRVAVRSHGGHGTKLAATHEGGHVAVAKAVGARVHSAEIFPDGSGVTWVTIPRNVSPVDEIAINAGGEVAAGTSRGCASDQAYTREVLSRLPASERGRVKRAGYSKASSVVNGFWSDGGVSATAKKLLRDGRA